MSEKVLRSTPTRSDSRSSPRTEKAYRLYERLFRPDACRAYALPAGGEATRRPPGCRRQQRCVSQKSNKGRIGRLSLILSGRRWSLTLGCVDYCRRITEPDPLNLITIIRPDVLVKGGDWPVERISAGDRRSEWRSREDHSSGAHMSTTSLIQRIAQIYLACVEYHAQSIDDSVAAPARHGRSPARVDALV